MTNNDLYEELQSSYRKFNSNETALAYVHDTICRAIDDNKSIYYLLCSILSAVSIPLTMVYFQKDLNLDSVSVEQPKIDSSHTFPADYILS